MSFSADGCWCRSWAEKGDEARQFLAGFLGTYRFCRNFGRESSSWLRFFTGVNPPELTGLLAGRQRRHALGNIGRVLISAQIAASYALTLRLRRGYVFFTPTLRSLTRVADTMMLAAVASFRKQGEHNQALGRAWDLSKKELNGEQNRRAAAQPPVYRIIIILFVRDAPPTRPACVPRAATSIQNVSGYRRLTRRAQAVAAVYVSAALLGSESASPHWRHREFSELPTEPAHGLNVCDNLIVVTYRLRIVGREHKLRHRQFRHSNAYPFGASLGGIIGTRPSGTIVEQTNSAIVIERLSRLSAMPRNCRRPTLLPLLKPANAWEIRPMPPAKCEGGTSNLKAGSSSRSPLLMSRTVATIRENSQPSIRPRSSASMCAQLMTRGREWIENIEAEVGGGLPKWAQSIHVECLPWSSEAMTTPGNPSSTAQRLSTASMFSSTLCHGSSAGHTWTQTISAVCSAEEFSLMVATVRLINSGLLDELPAFEDPGLAFCRGHRSLSPTHSRASATGEGWTATIPRHGRQPRKPFDHYLRNRLFYDCAGWSGPDYAAERGAEWVRIGMAELPVSQLVFATDYPQAVRDDDEIVAYVKAVGGLGSEAGKFSMAPMRRSSFRT